MERQATDRKYLQNISDKRLIIKIYKVLLRLSKKMTNNPILKERKKSKATAHQRRCIDNKEANGKRLFNHISEDYKFKKDLLVWLNSKTLTTPNTGKEQKPSEIYFHC